MMERGYSVIVGKDCDVLEEMFAFYKRSMPIAPVPGDTVVLMAASPGEWDEDTMPIESVLDDGEDGGWMVTIDGSRYVVQRGSDGRWWTYGALSERDTR